VSIDKATRITDVSEK